MGILVRCLEKHDHFIQGAPTAREAWAAVLAYCMNNDKRGEANLRERMWSVKYKLGMAGGMLAHIAKV